MISLLGTFRLTLHGELAPIGSGSKSERLLIHLALAGRRHVERVILLEHLWPDNDPARASQSLNSLVYHLNKLAQSPLKQASIITNENGHYSLNRSAGVGVDIDYFDDWRTQGKRLLRHGDAEKGIVYCERALELYRGDLTDASSIEAIIERERLRAAYLDLLASLADYAYSDQDPEKALSYIHRLLKHDPCREDAHRLAMRCYVRLGTRAQALRQYQVCCQVLKAEFDAKPEPETEALFYQIRLDPKSI
jgi:DNA-binding SARP family transcriptional activator